MRNILLAVCGMAPQVITEALYGLLHEGRQVHAVHVITTRQGKEGLLSGLFGPDCHHLEDLLADFGLTETDLEFSSSNIHTLKNEAGLELEDIVTHDDNEILLKSCLELSFSFTREPDTSVLFLVAGGRKTMTSCLTLAAQFYGRSQDRLLHVLVSPEFENCRDFWFPPKNPVTVQLADSKGQPYFKETRYAEIQLITIPLLSVRDSLDGRFLDRPRPPAELMQSLIRDTPKMLVINLTEGKVCYGKMEQDFHPARLALYAYFADRKKECARKQPCSGCQECFVDAATVVTDDRVAGMYVRVAGSRLLEEMSISGINNLTLENFQSYKSKIRRDLLYGFGPSQIADLEIASMGSKPDTRYGIRLDKSRIRMEW